MKISRRTGKPTDIWKFRDQMMLLVSSLNAKTISRNVVYAIELNEHSGADGEHWEPICKGRFKFEGMTV